MGQHMTKSSREGVMASTSRTGAFLVTFVLLLVITIGFLSAVDALPEGSKVAKSSSIPVAPDQTTAMVESPIRVVSPSVDLDVTISNPVSTNVEVLDHALLSGAVRYPTSAKLGVNGTVLLFGHSSYLPVIHNQAYKAFTGIQNLKAGEVVSVYSEAREYRYKVVSVRVADATEDVIELPTTNKRLVLVTCDSFTKKTNRFVVTAELVGTYSLVQS